MRRTLVSLVVGVGLVAAALVASRARPGDVRAATAADSRPCPHCLPAPMDDARRRFALVIGHNTGSAGKKPLRYAEHDASEVAQVFRELGGFLQHDVLLLKAPTVAQVRSALATLDAKVGAMREAGPGRKAVVTFYFSGHSDGKVLELGNESLPFAEVKSRLGRLRADLQVVLLDACQSGSLLALKGGGPAPGFPLGEQAPDTEGLVVLTSAAADEVALESSELGASYFSHHLISGLRGAADVNHDGQVTLIEAYEYASTQTVAETASTVYGPQHPNYYLRLAGRNDLVLTRVAQSNASLQVPAIFDRVHVIEARSGTVAVEFAGDSARRVALPPGPYVIKAWQRDQVRTARLTLGLGQNRRLEEAELTIPRVAPPADSDRPGAPVPPSDDGPARPPGGGCSYRCSLQTSIARTDCTGLVRSIDYDSDRSTWQIDVPRRGELVLKFQVCEPRGLWMNLADSPSCNGGGGDSTQFSNDAEIEFRDQGLWVFPNDYGRSDDDAIVPLGGATDFVAGQGCSERTVVVSDRRVQSRHPALKVESDYALRLDPPRDDEGESDRRWFLGINRSVGSTAPDRAGSGLAWVSICLR